jgi:hypothetical protein
VARPCGWGTGAAAGEGEAGGSHVSVLLEISCDMSLRLRLLAAPLDSAWHLPRLGEVDGVPG